ncbi:hypothetical protein KYC5002_02855 [Archangium violaceum]|uniref:hypothetical protein n=1 Tax=Archangium violaceum TaxID=83451 RepID=UPI002B28F805|nr:hypothetical protein KYC5002_02855 [Archangium gephyra]
MMWKRRLVMACACVGLLSACHTESSSGEALPPPAARGSLTFGRAEPPRAAEIRFLLAIDVNAEVREKGEALALRSSARSSMESVTRYRVLETNAQGLAVEVTFVKERESDGRETETGPLEGHTYVLDTRGGARTVTERGHPAGAEAREHVLEVFEGSLGETSDLGRVLGGRTVASGQRLPELEAALARTFLLGSDEERRVSAMSVRFQERDPDARVALADVEMEFILAEHPIRVLAPLRGTVSLDIASGALRSLSVSGPARVEVHPEAAASGMTARGDGTVRLEVDVSVLKTP